jgi:hypothetical protein
MIVLFNQHIGQHELTSVVASTFANADDRLNRRKKQPHRVKCNGKYIITESEKTVWPSIGAAKNAVRNHLNTSNELNNWLKRLRVNDAANRDAAVSPYYSNRKDMVQIIEYLEKNNIIEYVPYTDGE